jgi:hypothetical protein
MDIYTKFKELEIKQIEEMALLFLTEIQKVSDIIISDNSMINDIEFELNGNGIYFIVNTDSSKIEFSLYNLSSETDNEIFDIDDINIKINKLDNIEYLNRILEDITERYHFDDISSYFEPIINRTKTKPTRFNEKSKAKASSFLALGKK